MRQFFPPLPARVAGFLLPSERHIVNRLRLLRRAGLTLKQCDEASDWIAKTRFVWIANRRRAIFRREVFLSCI